MITVQETTVWSSKVPNHKYILSDDRRTMFGYIKVGSRLPTMFAKPMSFDAAGRKFHVLVQTSDVNSDVEVWNVDGSNGNKYTVTRRGSQYRCTCPRAVFRGEECKHITSIRLNGQKTNRAFG